MGYRELTGYVVTEVGPGSGRASGRLEVTEDHLNMGGILHGGALATLCDSVMGRAVRSVVDQDKRTATATMTMTYLSSALEGDVIQCEARVIKAGRTTVVVEASVHRESDERELARSVATFVQSDRRPS